MFPSINIDMRTLELLKNCEIAMVTYKYRIQVEKKNTVFVHYKKTSNIQKITQMKTSRKYLSLGFEVTKDHNK